MPTFTRRWVSALCGWVLLGLALSAGAQGSRIVTDDRGITQSLQPPQRIISLLPSLTESVCVLGACERLVAVDRYSDWPVSVQRLPKVGGLDDAVVERIVALKPDVVLAATSTRAVARLESLGLKVLAFDSDTQDQVRRSLRTLGEMLGDPSRGDEVWLKSQTQIDQAAQRLPAAWRGQSLYLEVDAGLYAASETSFVGQTLRRLGLANIAPAALGAFPKMNPEAVVRARPHLILIGETGASELPRRPGWASIPAVRQGRICALAEPDFRVLTRPGPRLGEAAEVIVRCLQRWPAGPGTSP